MSASALDKMRKAVVAKAVEHGAVHVGQPSLQERLRQAPPEKAAGQEVVAKSLPVPASSPEPAPTHSEIRTPKPKKEPKADRSIPLTVSMPSLDVARIQKIRKRAAKRGEIYPKSQIVRAALIHFDELEDGVMLGILKRINKDTEDSTED